MLDWKSVGFKLFFIQCDIAVFVLIDSANLGMWLM